ncbi:hypothetical protein EXN66_Car010983 [Channa argus]|uniref:Peptidase C80 domain-containing protein n=1 Tax=Channa argus TaxID=215402 RepID=A0A6G1PYI5_CHAAH|nr:hypothetical protein EXN66_Car010983 [Channa argus]
MFVFVLKYISENDADEKETPTSSALYLHSCNNFPVIRRTRIPTGVMGGLLQSWRLLLLVGLLSLTEPFEVRDDEWEELSPDIAALHRLRGLSEHMFHQSIKEPSDQRLDIDQNPMSLQDDLQGCENFTACVIQKEKDFDSFLAAIDKQKTHDWLLSASEISHSYSQKLLIMTDSETTTNDRVQHEYSMDPRYSVIISNQCLYNESCLPDADVYTVVKIFGRVSADGQTVSGLSGSSIAELMMKPSLEAVPVFSFDGNTTTDFQHNFMRVFVVRGIKAVLETNQKNHQIYQVMDQPDSVSSYRIPQRPVDPSTQYDHQQILIMEDDPVVRKAATYLYEKHPSVSSVYVLDQNQKPKLIHGDPVPLSEYSRLVLVGHGRKDNSGEMRLGGHKAQDVAEIIQKTYRSSNKIKTTSVVACEVGSDKVFVETLVRQLHDTAHIETELHLRNSLVQVRHTREKITQEIFSDGLRWRHKDDSKKVVAMLDRNGDVIVRDEPGSKGEAVFTNERNFLMDGRPRNRFLTYGDSWPDEPQRFIDSEAYKIFNKDNKLIELEALTWGFFHGDLPLPGKTDFQNLQEIEGHYLIGRKTSNHIEFTENRKDIKDILSKCYEIKSGKDIRSIIRHYAKTGENKLTYLMVNDWIYEVNPKSLYVYLVGKKLGNNQRGNEVRIKEVKKCITDQINREKYSDMKNHIRNHKDKYPQYVKDIFLGEPTRSPSLSTEAWFTTYFTASVISESARNFRTFPLILMALDMVESQDNNIREKGLNFFFEDHPMARGNSWIDPSRRGFSGSATPKDSSKLQNVIKRTTKELMEHLEIVLRNEVQQFESWIQIDRENILPRILEAADKYKIAESNSIQQKSITDKYKAFKETLEIYSKESGDSNELPASGTIGGYDDGHITSQDVKSASKWEDSFKHESYFSRVRASYDEQIHNELKSKYGGNLQLQGDSARIENGQFICQLVSDSEPAEFRIDLSPESQQYNEKMLKSIETAVNDMETYVSQSSHPVSKFAEHAGTAVGTLGLMLGMKGAVRAFEQGDIKDGVMGSLQTAHGVTAMTTSVIAKQALSSEARVARAAATIMRSPAMKGAMTAIPIVGIGFGLWNIRQDLERGDTLGYIDATLDSIMVGLDSFEIAQPEVAPVIMSINLVLSTVRMGVDDVYMGIYDELNRLPKDTSVLDKVKAVFVGFGKGIQHFGIHVASFFYDWRYDEIEEGRRLVEQISDYHKYYRVTKEEDGTSAIDFSGSDSSWNGGGINFCLADQGQSEFCMDYFVSSDESFGKKCWYIDTQGSKDIILGLGESHQLEYKTLQKKVLMFIPAGSVKVVSGYKAVSYSRYGNYKGNRESNRFFAVQKSENKDMIEVMLSYYYRLYGEPGDDIFFLGRQKSYVEGSGGKDTYMIPENGGKTIINNYDPSKSMDTLHFSVDYNHISVSKSGDDVVLIYEDSHTVIMQNWFLGESYRHMRMMSGDGVLFEISSTVVSSVQLVTRGINKMFMTQGQTVNTSQPLLRTVTNILGSPYDDVLIGNTEKNLIDGGGGRDLLIGGEGEDLYIVNDRKQSSVWIENYSRDNETDLVMIEANLHTFTVWVQGDNVTLSNPDFSVTLVNWFRSPADRHLLVVTKDLITFIISDKKTDCLHSDPFNKCIKSYRIDYSKSQSPLIVDLQEDEALNSVTEVRGSNFDDDIRGNQEHNVFVSGSGDDFIQGRGGVDWYIITPGQGVKTINNESPDGALDVLFLQQPYQQLTCTCEGQNIIVLVNGNKNVILEKWFVSENYRHLQIKTSDGITAGLKSNLRSCGGPLMLPLTVDYRNQEPEPLVSPILQDFLKFQRTEVFVFSTRDVCFRYINENSEHRNLCGLQGKVMMMNDTDSVKEMYGSSGFDIMVGNSNDNLLDPYTGGALMSGRNGKDTYIIKHGYGDNIMIDNFAEDQKIDTVLVDMDFLDGSQIQLQRMELDSSLERDQKLIITTKGEKLHLSLLNYNNGYQHQHLEFQSSDGVHFKLVPLNSTGEVPVFVIEAFKVTLKQSQVDCHLDLNSVRNLSKVHTVQGCPSQSNTILGNDEDNALIGGWKDDALEGGEGDDTLIGGNGDDLLIGGFGDDTLYGEDGNDTMMGNSGRDVFIPGPGADLVNGGPGKDAVLYRGDHEKGEGVYVNLLTGQGRYADAEGDVLKDVETVIGTIYSDILVSGYESALLTGSDGNDILVSTGGDYLVGGDGSDIYMLAFHHGSVTINNCAKDNATDVLYLHSQSTPMFDGQRLSDTVLLTFYGINQTTVKITLQDWVSDHNECGHLMLVFKDKVVSVDRLLQEFQFRQKERVSYDHLS